MLRLVTTWLRRSPSAGDGAVSPEPHRAVSPALEEIEILDPERDHQRIVYLSTWYDFPHDTPLSMQFALFRSCCVPRVAALLERTRVWYRRGPQRQRATTRLVLGLMEWGYDSERGRAALQHINRAHARFDISNEDFLYVLSAFVYEPIRWNRRFGWRLLSAAERQALFLFWREVGRRMNLRNLPPDSESFERFNRAYERRHFRFAECNRRVGTAIRGLCLALCPWWGRRLVAAAIAGLMDEPARQALGFAAPPALVRWLVSAAFRLRAGASRRLPPARAPRLPAEWAGRGEPGEYRAAPAAGMRRAS